MPDDQLLALKQALHGGKNMDVVSQCKVVGDAMENGAPYMENYEGLALFLSVSKNKVYQMKRIHDNMVDEVKDYFRKSRYKVHTTFLVASLSPDGQLWWLKQQSFSI